MAKIQISERCKSYATEANAQKAADKMLPATVPYAIHSQGGRFYPVVILTPSVARQHGVLFPFYTTGAA